MPLPSWLPTRIARRLLIGAGVFALLIAVYAFAGFVEVPRVLRSQAQDFVKTHYGRRLGLGEIHFNPFTLTLDMRDISMPDADGAPMVSVGWLHVKLRFASIWRRGPAFQEILLDRPYTRVLIRRDGSLNLADLAKPLEAPAAKAPPPAKSAPLRLFLDRLAVTAGRTSYEDFTRETPFHAEISPIQFDLRDFSTTGSGTDRFTLDFSSAVGERFHWDGNIGTAPVASRGHFSITALRAQTLWSYVRDTVQFEIPSGTIALQGEYDFSTGTNPLQLQIKVDSLTLDDLGVRPRGGTMDYIDIHHLDVQGTSFDLSRRALTIPQVRVAGGQTHVWLTADGKINLMELTGAAAASPSPGSAAAPPSTAPPSTAPPWVVSVPDIELSDYKVAGEDRTLDPAAQLTLEQIHIKLGGYHSPGDVTLDLSADMIPNGAGRIQAQGKLDLPANTTHAQLQLAGVDLKPFQAYLSHYTALSLRSGLLATKLTIDRNAKGEIAVSGDTEVSRFRTVDELLQQDFVKWEQLTVAGMQLHLLPTSLKIRTITARAPYARVIIASDRSVNIAEALAPRGAQSPAGVTAAPAAAPAPATVPVSVPVPKQARHGKKVAPVRHAAPPRAATTIPIEIAQIRIQDGSANYADLWIQPHFAVGIQQLAGTITGLSSDPASRATVDLKGKVDRYAPVEIAGTINPLSAALFTDIKMSFHGMELSSVTPYSGHFAGYKIEKGKVSVDLHYHVEDRQLNADHHFVIDQLQLGDKVDSPDAMHLPLKLAVALLKDRNGVIDLGLPVTGSLDDPQFKLGPIIWKAIVNVLTKIVTAPFTLLGKLFGGSEQMNLIDFAPGSAELDATAKDRLNGVVKALKERPHLEMDIPSIYSPEVDTAGLGTRVLNRSLLALKKKELGRKAQGDETVESAVLADPAEHFRLLVEDFKALSGKDAALPEASAALVEARKKKQADPAAYPAAISELESNLAARTPVTAADLEALARRRAAAVQDALLGGGEVEPARVFVVAATSRPAVDGKARMELALK